MRRTIRLPKFLIATAAILSAVVLVLGSEPGMAAHGGGMGGGGMGGGATVDPPAGAPLRDPPELVNTSTTPGVVSGTLDVRETTVDVNGTPARLLTYNGSFPGPTIRVRRGDVLRLRLVNSLPETTAVNMLGFERNHTNLHTHGLHVSPEEPADAAHLDIPAGGSYDYEYDLAHVYPGALNFYHPHAHGLVAEQYWAGLVGGMVVEDEVPALAGYETHLLVLKDMSLAGGAPTPYTVMMDYMHGKEGDLVMVNGQVNPVVTMRPGQIQRWRIVNASNARFYKLSFEGHSLHLVGTDGGLLDKPYAQSSLLVSPGERVDVLVKAAKTTGTYKLLALPYARRGMMTSAQVTLMTARVQGRSWLGSLPRSLDPDAVRVSLDTNALPHRTLTLSMSMGRGYINGMDFDVEPYMFMSELGTYEVWDIVNASGMDHPFHQHVDGAQILSVTGGDAAYASLYTTAPAWKDVVIVPKWGSVRLLVEVADWPGMTMFHCHIIEHEDIGMMGMWHRMGMMMGAAR